MAFLMPILVATLATASPLTQFVTKQALPSVPQGWQLQAAAPAEHKLNLHIRLKEENLDQLEKRALEIADPDHADYRKHLSKAEVDALTAPTKDTVDAVAHWLSSQGVEVGEVQSGFLSVTVSVNQAKKLLDADYGIYKEASTGRQTVRTTSYSLPQGLHNSIAMIQPTTLFSDLGVNAKRQQFKSKDKQATGSVARSTSARAAALSSVCDIEGTSTKCLREDYNITGYTPSAGKTKIGISGYLGEVPDLDALSRFLKVFDSDIPSTTSVNVISVNNGSLVAGGGGEANLDVQIAVPLTYPIETVYYSTGGQPPYIGDPSDNDNEPYLDWLQYVLALDDPPQTISSSYGDGETTVPGDYADAVCTQFLKLGARGVSIFVSSGDSGAGGSSACEPQTKNVVKYHVGFPTSCPWVTSVGGTTNYGAAETARTAGGSGFSNHFPQPAYQRHAVAHYIEGLQGNFSAFYNASGRAYPDISANFDDYPIYDDANGDGFTGGTSASSPAVASIFALLNDYLVSNGKAPLGFINPFLYKKGYKGVRDIHTGHSNVCSTVPAFPARRGWDSASGFGVPDFGKLLALV